MSTMMNTMQRNSLIAAVVLCSLLAFLLDSSTPLGIEIWFINLPLILIPVLLRSHRMVISFGLLCSAMVVLGSLLSPPGSNPRSWDILNRGIGIAGIWLIAVLALFIIKTSTRLNDALGSLRREIAAHEQTERALERSEGRLRLAAEGAGMGTFEVNLHTGRAVWSAAHLRMLGYQTTADRETTIDLWRSCIHPNDVARVLAAREESLQRRSAYAIEYRINRADNGATVWLAVFGRYYDNESGEGVRFVGVAFDITQRKELERELLGREVLAIAEREQRQIGQELHDGVGQELTGLGLMAQSLAQRLPEASAEKRIAHRLAAELDNVHRQVRELSRGLIPVHVESRGLAAALDDLAAKTSAASGISVTAECPEWVELPDHPTATQLLRIAQEAVSNALRHGRPRHIRLTLLTETDGLRLRIKDDGIGMQRGLDQSDGLGLRIMQFRAGVIGGVLQVGPSQGGGTVVCCTLPRSNGNGEEDWGSGLGQGDGLDRG
jgi:PAS domain S-box-containing protein